MNYPNRPTIYLLFLFLSLSFALSGQSPDCGFDQAYQSALENEPNFQEEKRAYEKAYQDYMQSESQRSFKGDEFLNLPLVIHVLHSGDSLGSIANPRDEVILDAISHTNNIFRQNGTGIEFENPNYGADTEISFCLTNKDEAGDPTLGILRYAAPINFDFSNLQSVPSFVRDQFWNQDKYINIVISNLNGICGAYFPGTDELLVSTHCLQDSETMAHEIGHYLSLHHTFFSPNTCRNGDCLEDGDFVCDTPPQENSNLLSQDGYENQPCLHPGNSCQSDEDDPTVSNPYRSVDLGGFGDQPDANSNIMGYGGVCRSNFTRGQSDRMRFNLNNKRQGLWSNGNICGTSFISQIDAGVEKININAMDMCGEDLEIRFELMNYGQLRLNEVDILLYRNFRLIDSMHWSGSLEFGEVDNLNFTEVRANLGENVFWIQTKNPNSTIDDNPSSDNNYIKYYNQVNTIRLVGENQQVVCESDYVEIGIDLADFDENFNFIWRRENGLIASNVRNDSILRVSIPDTYSVSIYTEDYTCEWVEQIEVKQGVSPLSSVIIEIEEVDLLITCQKPTVNLIPTEFSLVSLGQFNMEWYNYEGIKLSERPSLEGIEIAGEYRFRLFDKNLGCGIFSEWYSIADVRDLPTVSINVDSKISCENSTAMIDGSLSDFEPGKYIYTWRDLSTGQIIVKDDSTRFIQVSSPSTYSLEIADKITQCSNSIEVEVEAESDVPTINIEKPENEMNLDVIRLDASKSSSGAQYEFEWYTEYGSIVEGGNTLNPMVEDLGVYRLEIINSLTGCTISKIIDLSPIYNIQLTYNCFYNSSSIRLEFTKKRLTNSLEIPFENALTWTTPDGADKPTIGSVSTPGLYKVAYTDKDNNIIKDSILMLPEMFELPSVSLNLLDSVFCSNNTIELSIFSSRSNEFSVFIWRDANGIFLSNELSIEVQEEGLYSLEVVNSLNTCNDLDYRKVVISSNFSNAYAGEDKYLSCDINQVEIGQNEIDANYSYQWNLVSDIDTTFLGSDPVIQVDQLGQYQLEMYNAENDCYTFDDVEVKDLSFDYHLQIRSSIIDDSCGVSTANLFVENIENYYDYDLYWILPDGSEIDKLVLPASMIGEYTLQVKSISTGCSYTETFFNNCDVILEVQDQNLLDTESIILMPNPASDHIQIFIQSGDPLEEIIIYNTLGVCLQTIQDYQSLDWIDISRFSSGIYLAVLSGDSFNHTFKFVKE